MIENLVVRHRLKRIRRLREDRRFLANYLPIVVDGITAKADEAIARGERILDVALFALARKHGVTNPLTEADGQRRAEAVREVYSWKLKALAQSELRARKRKPGNATDVLYGNRRRSLESRLAARLAAVSVRGTAGKAADVKEYQTAAAALTSQSEARAAGIRRDAQTRIDRTRSSVNARLAALDDRIANLRKDIIATAEDVMHDRVPEGAILSVRNLSMRFGGLRAVDDLSFDVKEGEIFGLIGPNGAGKTTIFNCITRFYRPSSGEMFYRRNAVETILLNDYPVHGIIRQGIVRTFQNVELVWELSVLDNLLVAAHTAYRSGFFAQMLHTAGFRKEEEVMRARALDVLRFLDLLPYAPAFPYGLPYGILKKIELARTLMANPRLIILDEPAAGLNDLETEQLAQTIRRIRDEYHATIFLVEHDMGLVMNICDTVCAISFGKMLAIGTPAEIQANRLVRSAYLGEEA
jgi:branched-chain amino acid transport system ATP-binding protein